MRGPPELRLLAPAITVWVLTAVALQLPPAPVAIAAAGALLAGGLVLVRRRATLLAAVLLCAAAAGVAASARVQARTTGALHDAAVQRSAVTVEGVVLEDPRSVAARGGLVARELVIARLRVDRLTVAGQRIAVRSPVLVVSSDRGWLALLPSQRVLVDGLLGPARDAADVAAVLSTRGQLIRLGGPSQLQRVAARMRAGLRAAVAPLPANERGLLPGLVVGDVSDLPSELRDDFRTVGLTHLVAVSGTNVAVVVGAVLLLCAALGVPLRARPVIALAALAGFVVLARPSPSVLRAAVMGIIALLALTTGSRRSTLPALSAAVVVLLLLSPDLALSAGFALSVLATAGLVVLAPGWRDRWAGRLPRGLAEAIAIPAAAQVACGPVIVALSGQLGVLSVPANLLAVPAVAPATVLGLAAAVVAPVSGTLAHALAWAAWLPTSWLVQVASWGARLPGSTVPWLAGGGGAALLVLATAVGALVLRSRPLRRLCAAGCTGVLAAAAVLWAAAPAWPPPGWFLVACDVGQGDGLVLAAGAGTAVVVDTGPDPRAMDGCLRRLRVRRVPLVILTHLHADHVEGLPGVLRGRKVGQIQIGPLDEPLVEFARVRRWAAAAGVPIVRAAVGEDGQAGRARWRVLAPERPFRGTASDPNNSSLVLRLTAAGGRTALLTGDVEGEAQQSLLDLAVTLRADVLKVPHHGSSHQLPAFLAAVGPRVSVTSVGADNPFGHPAAATLGQLLRSGSRSYRTDLDGDVALVDRDGQLSSAARRGAGTAGDATAATALELIPGTQLTARSADLSRLAVNWCGGSARAPPLATRAAAAGCLAGRPVGR